MDVMVNADNLIRREKLRGTSRQLATKAVLLVSICTFAYLPILLTLVISTERKERAFTRGPILSVA